MALEYTKGSLHKQVSDTVTEQLLISLVNLTSGASRSSEGTRPAGPAGRLIRCFLRVLTQRKNQYVNERLQRLVFAQCNQSRAQQFELPEGISSPRMVQEIPTREAWWWHVRGQPETQRKQDQPPARERGPTSQALARRLRPPSRGKAAEMQASPCAPVALAADIRTEEPEAPSKRYARSQRNAALKRATARASLTGDVALAAKEAAHATTAWTRASHLTARRRGSTVMAPRGQIETRFGVMALQCDTMPVATQSALNAGPGGTSAWRKMQAEGHSDKTRRCVTDLQCESFGTTEVFLKKVEARDEQPIGLPFPNSTGFHDHNSKLASSVLPPESFDVDAVAEGDCASTKPASPSSALVAVVIDASGGVLNCSGSCGLMRCLLADQPQAEETRPTTPSTLASLTGTAEELALPTPKPDIARTRSMSMVRRRSANRRPGPLQRSSSEPNVASIPARPNSSNGAQVTRERTAAEHHRDLEAVRTYDEEARNHQQGGNAASGCEVRFDVARTLSNIRDEAPPQMARTEQKVRAISELGLVPGNARVTRGSLGQGPSSSCIRAHSSSGTVDHQATRSSPALTRPSTAASDSRARRADHGGNKVIPGDWGAEFEKVTIAAPPIAAKMRPNGSRQSVIDHKITRVWDTRCRRWADFIDLSEPINGVTTGPTRTQSKAVPASAVGETSTVQPLRPHEASLHRSASAGPQARARSAGMKRASPDAHVRPQLALPAPPRAQVVEERPPADAARLEASAHAYLNEAAALHRLPNMPKCLHAAGIGTAEDGSGYVEYAGAQLPFDIQHLNLVDDDAAPLLKGMQQHNASFESLLLAGNPRLTDITYMPLLKLVCARSAATGVRINRLDLSDACGVGEMALSLLAQELRNELKELRILRMDRVSVPERAWPMLEAGIQGLIHLEDLSLADMKIGRLSQRSSISVAEMLLGLPALRTLDISGNFFGLQGCKALADNIGCHSTLSRLDLSYNAGGFVDVGHSISCAGAASLGGAGGAVGHAHKAPGRAGCSGLPTFNPVSLVCESVASARALKVLKLANCQLNFDEDFVLEDAIAEKVGDSMEELDLSGNPCQGPMGARCLLRLVIHTPSLCKLEVREFQEALPTSSSIAYELVSPSRQYDVDLGHPQHRALCRTLLRRCRKIGREPKDLFDFKDSAFGWEVVKSWKDGRGIPSSGHVTFTFQLASAVSSKQIDIVALLNKMSLARKVKVSLWAFVRIAELYRGLIDHAARRVLLGAMASDLLLKLCHVKYLSDLDIALRIEVIELLLPAVHQLDRMGGFDLVLNARGKIATPLHIARIGVFTLLTFNPYCPNGHYCLNLSLPCDRHMLVQLQLINKWERTRAEAQGHADLSQHGDHECLRNVSLNGQYLVWRSAEAMAPPRGELSFDYCSPFHPQKGSPTSDDDEVLGVERLFAAARCDQLPKLAVLRTVLHKFTLTSKQCARLTRMFPRKGFDNEDENQAVSFRVDAFVVLYARCVDIAGLVSSERYGLYGLHLFDRADVLKVRSRLGRIRTWDITRIECDHLIPSNKKSASPSSRTQAVETEDSQHLGVLTALRIRDDPTSHNANRYVFDLSVYEDWWATKALLDVACKESGVHFDAPSWSEKAHLEARGTSWLVPGEWHTELPTTGIFTVRYFLEKPEYKDLAAREKLAEKYLGW